MKVVNKIVRNKIPDIIKDSGRKLKYRNITGKERVTALVTKLVEEAEEVLDVFENGTVSEFREEMADLHEVFQEILRYTSSNLGDVLSAGILKNADKGDFSDGVFLESYEEKK